MNYDVTFHCLSDNDIPINFSASHQSSCHRWWIIGLYLYKTITDSAAQSYTIGITDLCQHFLIVILTTIPRFCPKPPVIYPDYVNRGILRYGFLIFLMKRGDFKHPFYNTFAMCSYGFKITISTLSSVTYSDLYSFQNFINPMHSIVHFRTLSPGYIIAYRI